MNKTAYQTGTIELMPYSEHGEFCIVGVFAVNVEKRKLSYKILNAKKTKRLSNFFPEMERLIFSQTLKSVHEEWDALKKMVNDGSDTNEFEMMNQVAGSDLFTAITYPREGIIRHKARGIVLADKIENWLDTTFNKMVLRQELETVIPEEQKLTREVKSYIKELKLGSRWKEHQVGNNTYHARFPFAYCPNNESKVARAIKPLFLGQNDSTKIIEHGDTWIQKVRRLNQFNLAPEVLVFPVKIPKQEQAEQYDHANMIIQDLEKEGVKVLQEINIEQFKPFILTEDVSDTPLFAKEA